jgi:dTDP-4-dehydrorhamnose 3,5-epimerase
MAYISMTLPGIARGPHEHTEQADFFCFIGPSTFKVYLWDNRPAAPTHGNHESALVGIDNPMALIIPPGVAHAYKNVGQEPGLVFNCPNRLYKGHGRKEPVDEIRHEEDGESPFRLE